MVFVSLFLLPLIAIAVAIVVVRSPYKTAVGVAPEQPVPFSHKHHAGELNIDCRYCHQTVETSPFAGLPATEVCMTCHSQLWTQANMLAPVRQSLANNSPLPWTRVNNVADFVYFDHSIHVTKGVGCETCHGRIDQMPLTYAVRPFFMSFCLDCHREPEKFLRPQTAITTMGWQPDRRQEVVGQALVKSNHIVRRQLTDCSICHR